MFDLSGKVALVTGGNGGIGLGIAMGLAEAGAGIAVAARDQSKTADALDQIGKLGVKTMGLSLDVTRETSVSSAISQVAQRFGRVDILVNNAGTVIRKAPEDVTVDEWDQVHDTNLRGTFLCAREVHPLMVRAGGGKIINIGSMTSVFGSDWVASYAASKGGVVQLTKSLALSWAKDNIQVNAILPGWIHTRLTAGIKRDHPKRYFSIKSRIPHGRWGEPTDMAGAAIFLASKASDYVTGVSLPVDGGYTSF